jgi:hypothetical protein
MTNDGQSSAPEEIDKASLELHKLRVDTTKAELDVRNADLILRKLQSEEMKAAADARWALRQPRFEMIKTAATLLTVAAALLSLTLSQMQSHAQTERLERNRREEAVGNLLRDAVGGESEQFRRAALAELAMYAAEPNLRPRIQRQLLSVVRYEKQPAVRSAITEVLLAQPDSNLLTLLATGSRAIRREITARLAQRDPGVNETLIEAIRDTVLSGDSVTRDLVEVAGWHAVTLGRAISSLRVIRGQDFSDVAFAVYLYEVNKGEAHMYPPWQATFGSGLEFHNVDFRRAILGQAEFNGVEFDSVNFNEARLPNTYFDKATFRNTRGTAMLAGLDKSWPYLDGDDRALMPWFASVGAPTVIFHNSTADNSHLEFFTSEWERLLAIADVKYQGVHDEGLRPAIAEFERAEAVAKSTVTTHPLWDRRIDSDSVLRLMDSLIVRELPRQRAR